MKTGELADALGVSDETIRNWTNHELLSEFFSPEARGDAGISQRRFSEDDVLVATTIAHLRNREGITDWQEIANYLTTGKREQEFPANAISFDNRTIAVTQAEQSARAAATLAERDAALKRVDELEEQIRHLQDAHRQEIDRLREEAKQLRQEHRGEVEGLHDKYQEKIQYLSDQIAKLNRQIGRLEGDKDED